MLGKAKHKSDLGIEFAANLTETEINWLCANEFARTSDDVLWRRTKLGLKMNVHEIKAVDQWMIEQERS